MISENELKLIKKQLIEDCKETQRKLIENAKEAMLQAQESANEEEGATEEKFESFRAQCQADRDMFAKQMQDHISGLSVLSATPFEKICKTVQPGAVVITDSQRFFISISMGVIKSRGESYLVVSPNAPLMVALSGKKVGDKIVFRDKIVEIKELF
jgi:hypothetical protein